MLAGGTTGRRLVGRTVELARLAAALGDAREGRPGVMQVVGDAGVGKTALARSLAALATRAGTSVGWGRCIEDAGAPPYHPWIQVLRAAIREEGKNRAQANHREAGSWRSQLDSSLSSLMGAGAVDASIPSGVDTAHARFTLFEAVTESLVGYAEAAHSLLVVLDDAHHADAASVRLLRFVAEALSDARLLVVTTGRRVLDELAEHSDVMTLRGLSELDVAAFFEDRTGSTPTAEEVQALHGSTGGNPLFLEQVVSSGSVSASEALADVLRIRVTGMPADVVAVLTAFAVLEEEVPASVVREVSGLQPHEFIEATDVAARAGLLVAPSGTGPQRFSHPLIREALYGALEPAQRRRLHLVAATALERMAPDFEAWGGGAGRAHHRRKALPLGDPIVAVDATLHAAAHATRTMAFEDAATMLTACLKALDRLPTETAAERGRLLIALAGAQSGAGQREAARTAARKAAGIARRLRLPGLQAKAALAMPRRQSLLQPDPELRQVVEQALAGVGACSPERVRLLARLAQEFPTDPTDRLRSLADEAAAVAARLQDPVLMALGHRARQQALWGAIDAHAERLASAEEMVALARAQGDVELELDGHMWRMTALLEAGRVGEAELASAAYRRLAEEVGHPWFLMFARSRQAMFAMLHGRVEEAERLAREARALAASCGSPEGDTVENLVLGELRIERRHDEALAAGVDDAERLGMPLLVALLLARLGRVDEARAALRSGIDDALDALPAFNRLPVLSAGARAACAVHDAEAARQIYDAIAPYHRVHVVIGGGAGYMGPASRYLGLCAAVTGRGADAVGLLESALHSVESATALPLAARICLELAQVLTSQGGEAASDRARQLGGRALALGRSIGLDRLVDEAEEFLSTLSSEVPVATSLRRDGDHWTLQVGAATATLKHSRGLEQLASLLAAPNREIAAWDLLSGAAGAGPAPGAPALDRMAKEAYRKRLRELDEALEAAAQAGDVRREEAADAEREALLRELRRAMGVGGRDRAVGSDTERARVNVTRTLRHALDQIAAVHPGLGGHLQRSVRTGSYCSYHPPPGEEQRWSL